MKVQKSGHMPLREGKMDCTSCHSPHGSTNVRMLKAGNTVNESCASCHAEKRGPFMWEHAAGRENCASCHDPHGSNNDRMLVAKAPMLCQRCHVASRHPATIYDGAQLTAASNRMVGRSCVNCHSQIHGSNHPSGNFFLR
jgi:DmsE family decaheme c-type cytochrome